MIYVTGDTHGDIDRFKAPELKKLRSGDTLIICGDFGFPFLPTDIIKGSQTNGEYRFWTQFLANLPCKILFIDGNHDNHSFWGIQDVEEWHGGKVHYHPDIPNAMYKSGVTVEPVCPT